MSGTCCSERPEAKEQGRCPLSQGFGHPVRWTTVVALSAGSVPPRQDIWLCPDTDCEVVYFGSQGLELRTEDVRTVPGFKLGSAGLVCYCFLHTHATLEEEVRTLGRSPTLESIRAQVVQKNCACEVRNPTGKCCLKAIQQIVRENEKKELPDETRSRDPGRPLRRMLFHIVHFAHALHRVLGTVLKGGSRALDKKQHLSAWGAATTGAGAAVVATAATACCVPVLAPLLISVLGVTGSVWAAGLKPYSLGILGLSGLFLAFGFWTVYRRPVTAGAACSAKRPVLVRWVLWFSALLWMLALAVNALQVLASRVG